MVRTARAFTFLISVLLAGAGWSAETVEQSVVRLTPVAERAREAMANHPTRHLLDIEMHLAAILDDAWPLYEQGKYADARELLKGVDASLGPLREIPHHKLQVLLLALAQQNGDTAERDERLAYRIALFAALRKTGDGESAATAYRAVFIEDENLVASILAAKVQWGGRQELHTPTGRIHVISAREASGAERKVYFDLSALQASYSRIMRRERGAQMPK